MFDRERKYQDLLSRLAVFIAMILIPVVINIIPELNAGLFNRPDKEDYDRLTSYVNIYAKTLDRNAIPNKNVEITAYYTQEDEIIITAEEMRCKVDAVYPMVITATKEGEYNVKVFYENGIYLASSNLKNIVHYIIGAIMIALFLTFLIYVFLCLVFFLVDKKRKK